MSSIGRGRSSTAYTAPKIALMVAMASAKVSTTVAEYPGTNRRCRTAVRNSSRINPGDRKQLKGPVSQRMPLLRPRPLRRYSRVPARRGELLVGGAKHSDGPATISLNCPDTTASTLSTSWGWSGKSCRLNRYIVPPCILPLRHWSLINGDVDCTYPLKALHGQLHHGLLQSPGFLEAEIAAAANNDVVEDENPEDLASRHQSSRDIEIVDGW
jgi:hypothetical protein